MGTGAWEGVFPLPGTCPFGGVLGLGVSHRGLERAHGHLRPHMALVPACALVRAASKCAGPATLQKANRQMTLSTEAGSKNG